MGAGGEREMEGEGSQEHSPANVSGMSGGSSSGALRKGPWTPEEDELLVKHIELHGEGNWTAVPKRAGLLRCGKSCRLRWANYLRPDLKKSAPSAEEEQLIIDLHKTLGNRWARIAQELPGRTDNDVKNYWNTKLKRRLIDQGLDPDTHLPLSHATPDTCPQWRGPQRGIVAKAKRVQQQQQREQAKEIQEEEGQQEGDERLDAQEQQERHEQQERQEQAYWQSKPLILGRQEEEQQEEQQQEQQQEETYWQCKGRQEEGQQQQQQQQKQAYWQCKGRQEEEQQEDLQLVGERALEPLKIPLASFLISAHSAGDFYGGRFIEHAVVAEGGYAGLDNKDGFRAPAMAAIRNGERSPLIIPATVAGTNGMAGKKTREKDMNNRKKKEEKEGGKEGHGEAREEYKGDEEEGEEEEGEEEEGEGRKEGKEGEEGEDESAEVEEVVPKAKKRVRPRATLCTRGGSMEEGRGGGLLTALKFILLQHLEHEEEVEELRRRQRKEIIKALAKF